MTPRYEANLSMLFTEHPLLERPAAAAEAGFGAVEFWWPFGQAVPGDREVDAFISAIGDAGVRLVGLNFFASNHAAPFGGWHDSGLGVEYGVEGLSAYLTLKWIHRRV